MNTHLSKRSRILTALMAISLVTMLTTTLLPEATATTIISIDPVSGHVGDIVRVVGEIDTVNGSYIIFFDEEEVKNGTAVETAVNETFKVPHRPLGNLNVTLQDTTTKNNYTFPTSFAVETAYYIRAVTPQPPQQLQEGELTKILVNITGGKANTVYSTNTTVIDPTGAIHLNDTIQLTNTTNTGYGEGNITYPVDFSLGANTDYVGIYTIAFNRTLETGNFTVGLTDMMEYRKEQTVNIQGSGYDALKNATINITIEGASVTGYPKNVTADAGGMVIDSWTIPDDAKPGTYSVTLANATVDDTLKTPVDAQNFTVLGAVCQIQTWNLADPPEPVANVLVEARNATGTRLESESTNITGIVEFWLELGNYTFEAFFKIGNDFAPVGTLPNQSITETKTYKLNLTCQLSIIKITVRDEAGNPLSFIDLTLKYTYTAVFNRTVRRTESYETNDTGTVVNLNTIANVGYEIEAWRYGHRFNRTLIENLTTPLWVNITCPTYIMFVHVIDSKDIRIQNVDVDIIEWSSGILVDRKKTNTLGSSAFSLTFGRYKVRVFNGSAFTQNTLVLNETIIDLTEDQFFFVIYCRIFNLNLSLSVIDYFGQPIPGVVVELERKFEQEYVNFAELTAGSDGTVLLPEIGGDYRISVYVMGKRAEVRTLYIDEGKDILFKMDRYIVVGGYPLESVQFVTLISLSILAVIFALGLAYRRISKTRVKKEEDNANQE